MIDFFDSNGFFAFLISASDALVFAVAPPMGPPMAFGVEIAASNGFLRESVSLLCTKSKASILTNLAYAWSAIDPAAVPFAPLVIDSVTSGCG